MLGICLAVVVWIVGGQLLKHVGLAAAPIGSGTLVLLATALSATGLLLLLLRASRGRLVTEVVSDGVTFGLVLGNVWMIALLGLVRFYPTLP